MAMITCPECKAEIADTAYDCPKCAAVLRKPTRSGFGKFAKWSFIGFNVLMLIWMIGGMSGASETVSGAGSDAEAAGAAIGGALGMGLLMGIWVFGDIILGFVVMFTRPSKS
jgi:hypothetical protein